MKNLLFLMACIIIACACPRLTMAQSDAGKKDNARDGHRESSTGQDTQPVAIESKPDPERPKEAGEKLFAKKVVLSAIFRSNGTVTDIKVVEVLPKGLPKRVVKELTDKCIKAARGIKFRPAMKDGRPVSMYYRIEYEFNKYGKTKEAEVPPPDQD
jgi:hypothetical protein